MTTRPGYVWDATASEWVEIGQAAVLAPVKYQATAPSSPATGDIWIESDVDVPSIDSAQFLRWRKTMVGGETSLSGNDDSSLPLAYTPGYEQLYINGVLQVRGQDYTATTGTTVTGLTALVANDVVEIFSAVARTVADVYTQNQSDARFVNRNVGGLTIMVPTSISKGASGTSSVGVNGGVTFTGTESIQLNGIFSSAYTNYKMIYNGNAAITAQFCLNGTPNTSSYGYSNHYTDWNGNHGIWYNNAGTATSAVICSEIGTIDIYNPAVAVSTVYQGVAGTGSTNGTFGGKHGVSTAYDGIKLIHNTAGLLTGTIRIYGYNNGA